MLPEAFANSVLMTLAFALGIVAVFCAVAFLVNFILGQVLNLLVRRHESPLQSAEIRVIGALRTPAILIIVVYGIRLALTSLTQSPVSSLGFISNLDRLGHNAWLLAITAVVCYTISRLIIAIMRWYSSRAPQDTRTALNTVIWPILIRITSIIVFTLGALVALDLMGVPITPLLAGLGIGGLAVALALSPTIASFIAGTYVVAEGHISEGDYVEIDSERSGFVTSIGWRSTVLLNIYNNVIIVPNNLITESVVINYATPTPAVAGTVECGVSYSSDLKEVTRICLEVTQEVIDESGEANKDYEPSVRFFEFADSNINFRIFFQGIDRLAMFAIRHEIIIRLHARFAEEGIEINYPVRKLTTALPDDDLPDADAEEIEEDTPKDTPPPTENPTD